MKRNALMQECRGLITPEIRDEIDFSIAIVNRIFDILELKKITQREFAKRMGKNEAEISRWMQGTHNFTMSTIKKIERVLGEPLLIVAGSQQTVIEYKTIVVEKQVFLPAKQQSYIPDSSMTFLPTNSFVFGKEFSC